MEMGVLEIVSSIVLILTSVIIILLVMLQSAKGNGLAGAIGGGEMMMGNNQGHTRDAILAKWTKVAGIVFFVVTIAVSLISAFAAQG